MRYFRRELFDAVQRTSDAEAHAAWEQAREAYSCAFDNDRDRLPESARAAAERSWHDAVVTGATADGDAGATFWHVGPREVDGLRQEDDALEDAVLVRNLLATRPCVERCPFCGERLTPSASPHES